MLLLLVLSPVILFTALVVRISSPGPILFRQRRVGRDGKEFDLFKFRSMRMDTSSGARSEASSVFARASLLGCRHGAGWSRG